MLHPTTAGIALTTQPQVQIEDINGNITSSTSTITLTLYGDSACTTTPITLNPSNGASVTGNTSTITAGTITTFSTFAITDASSSLYVLASSSTGLKTACSSVISVNSNTPYTTSTLVASPSTGVIDNGIASSTLTFTIKDKYGNLEGTSTPVSFTVSPSAGTALTPVSPLTTTAGIATTAITSTVAQTVTITMTAPAAAVNANTTATVTFVATPTKLAFTVQPPTTGTAGTALASSTVKFTDNGGIGGMSTALVTYGIYTDSACTNEVMTNLLGNFPLTSNTANGNGAGTSTASIAPTITLSGTYYIGASSPGLTTACSSSHIVVAPGAASPTYSTLAATPSTGLWADGGLANSTQDTSTITATILDVYKNVVTTGTSVTLASTVSSGNTWNPSTPTAVTNSSGVTANITLQSTVQGVQTIDITSPAGLTAVTTTVTFVAPTMLPGHTYPFVYTGANQAATLGADAIVTIQAWGAGGAGGLNGAVGGGGGFVQGTFYAPINTPFTIVVGAGGIYYPSTYAGGGGGRSAVYSNTSVINRPLVVAGGGGGGTNGSGDNGGPGGGATGGNGVGPAAGTGGSAGGSLPAAIFGAADNAAGSTSWGYGGGGNSPSTYNGGGGGGYWAGNLGAPYAGGGGSGYVDSTLTSPINTQASGATVANATGNYKTGTGNGGATTAAGQNGYVFITVTALSGTPTQLAFTGGPSLDGGPSVIETSKCSGPYTVESLSSSGTLADVTQNTVIALSETIGAGTNFYAGTDTTCSLSTISTVTITNGASNAQFYMMTLGSAASSTLTAQTQSGMSLTSATMTVESIATKQIFAYTGAIQTLKVPANTNITIKAWGGGGGGYDSLGGGGGFVEGNYTFTADSTLEIVVGNGGAGSGAGNGGGRSAVVILHGNEIFTAAGGGGGYGGAGGAGGGATGGTGAGSCYGGGGTQTAAGATAGFYAGNDGAAYTTFGGGTQGWAIFECCGNDWGGGGGGGWFPGGQGGSEDTCNAGGGGGSSHYDPLATSTSYTGPGSLASGATPANTLDVDYQAGIGTGGTVNTTGGNGLVVINFN